MNATTIVALAGIAGTVTASALGTVGAIRAATVTARQLDRGQDRQHRRQAYAACASGLLECYKAAEVVMEGLIDTYDSPSQAHVRDLIIGHAELMQSVGVVAVEGPRAVAEAARNSAELLNQWILRLDRWAQRDNPQLMAEGQREHGRREQQETAEAIRRYEQACRRVLHPEEEPRR